MYSRHAGASEQQQIEVAGHNRNVRAGRSARRILENSGTTAGSRCSPMPSPPYRHILRLIFAYDGDALSLASKHLVEMTLPPSHELCSSEGKAGFWFELRDPLGRPLYRRIQHDPMPRYREAHAPGATPTHVTALRRGVFEILVPAYWEAATLVLLATEHPPVAPFGTIRAERARSGGPRVGTGAAREIARFSLDDILK
ncbi:hypothetical protein OKW50_007834 [Paraburkholderia youngii]|uniref:hypothetical protein n=1 Tax=Paraburkholderia youngii TaxID=2782701 RepID=UPI003D1BC8EA